jgi:hypothetical protein
VLVALAAVVGAGCGSSGDSASTTTTSRPFKGDADSPFCVRARAWKNMRPVDAEDLANAQAAYTAQADAVRGLQPVAPAAVAPALKTAVAFLDRLLGALAQHGWDLNQVTDPSVTMKPAEHAAEGTLNRYIIDVCLPKD